MIGRHRPIISLALFPMLFQQVGKAKMDYVGPTSRPSFFTFHFREIGASLRFLFFPEKEARRLFFFIFPEIRSFAPISSTFPKKRLVASFSSFFLFFIKMKRLSSFHFYFLFLFLASPKIKLFDTYHFDMLNNRPEIISELRSEIIWNSFQFRLSFFDFVEKSDDTKIIF